MNSQTKKTPETLPDALRNFDDLPRSASVRQPVVVALYACSNATLWRRVKAKTVPAPRKHSARVTVWNVGELRDDLAAKVAA